MDMYNISLGKIPYETSNITYRYVSDVTSSAEVGQNVTHVFERHSWTQFLSIHSPAALMVDRAITPMWYVVGIAGNIISAKIWTERPMRLNNSSAIYLATLSITDMLFLVLHILQELKYAWEVQTLRYPVVCEGYFLLYTVVQYLSPLLVLGFTVERYIAVCHPFKKEKYCTSSRAVKVVILLVLLCIMLSCIQAYFWTYDHETDICTVRAETLVGDDASFWSVWSWVSELVIFLLVPMVILTFNILVIKEIKKISKAESTILPGQTAASHGSVAATTVMLLSVAFYVIITTVPATLVYVLYSEFQEGDPYLTDAQIRSDPKWSKYLIYITGRKFVEEICISHYACNVFLYLITGLQFRASFLETFRWCRMCGRSRKYSEISSFPHRNSTCHTTYTTRV